MGRISETFGNASRGSRVVFLLAFFGVVIFHGIWWYDRFQLSGPLWLIPALSLPWWYWALPLINDAPRYLQPSLQAAAMAGGFALNSVIAYTGARYAWFAARPNDSIQRTAGAGLE